MAGSFERLAAVNMWSGKLSAGFVSEDISIACVSENCAFERFIVLRPSKYPASMPRSLTFPNLKGYLTVDAA